MFCAISSQIDEKHTRVVAGLLEIMLTISSNTLVCEHGLSCMNSLKSAYIVDNIGQNKMKTLQEYFV